MILFRYKNIKYPNLKNAEIVKDINSFGIFPISLKERFYAKENTYTRNLSDSG